MKPRHFLTLILAGVLLNQSCPRSQALAIGEPLWVGPVVRELHELVLATKEQTRVLRDNGRACK